MSAFGNFFGAMASALASLVKDTIHLRSLKKEDIQELLRSNISNHEEMAYILSAYSADDMKKWYKDKVELALKRSNSKAKDSYIDYCKKLYGKAVGEERKRPLGSLLEANKKFAKLLEEISVHIDKLVEQEEVDIYNVRMSHLAILGIMRQSDKLLNWSMYQYALMTKAASRNINDIPRYREVYLEANSEKVADICSQLLNKSGNYDFLKEVDTIRKKNADMVLGASKDFNVGGFVRGANYSPDFLDNIMSALSCLNIFSAAMDAWEDYKFAKYERNKEIKAWLEQHVSLLRMDLADMDSSSPEYAKTVAIIQAYDAKIAEYDRDIIEFEQEK